MSTLLQIHQLTSGPIIWARFFAPPEAHTDRHRAILANSDKYIDQLFSADTVVIATPMHNFGIASVLKSWVDNILRVGKTFRYTETGAVEGLLPQKKLVIIVGSGGIYSDGPMKEFEHAGSYLTAVFGFLGMNDISIIRAEGLAMGPEMAKQGIARAITHAVNLAAG